LKKFVLRTGCLGLLLLMLYPPVYAVDTGLGDLQRLIQRAFEGNDRLKQFEQTVRSARQEVDPSGSLDDPRLQAGAMNVPTDNYEFDDHDMTTKDMALMQKIPYPGILDLQQKQVLAEYRAKRAEMMIFRVELADQVRSTYFGWWAIRETRKIAREERNQLERLLSIARRRYETGKGIQADVQRATTRLSRLENRILKLEQREKERRERLRRLLGYRGDTFQLSSLDLSPATNVEPRSVRKQIEKTSPVLRRDTELIMAAKQGVQLAELDYYPSFDLGLRYRQREERDDFVSFSVTVPLPVWSSSKQTPRFKSKKNQLRAMRSRYRDNRDELQYSFDEALYRLQRIRRQLRLYDNQLLPEARQTMESTLSAYRVGRVEFVSVLDAELELFKVREEWVRLIADHEKTLSKLSKIAGFERMEELK